MMGFQVRALLSRRRVAMADGGICLPDEFILETHGLTKEFAGFFAVREVSLKVRRGTIHALIGPNVMSRVARPVAIA
jgi:hypothetical protein